MHVMQIISVKLSHIDACCTALSQINAWSTAILMPGAQHWAMGAQRWVMDAQHWAVIIEAWCNSIEPYETLCTALGHIEPHALMPFAQHWIILMLVYRSSSINYILLNAQHWAILMPDAQHWAPACCEQQNKSQLDACSRVRPSLMHAALHVNLMPRCAWLNACCSSIGQSTLIWTGCTRCVCACTGCTNGVVVDGMRGDLCLSSR